MQVKTWSPSRVARTLAAQEWPMVQQQTQLAKGVYGFSCAGHGGIVAVVGIANLDTDLVNFYRSTNRVEVVKVYAKRWSADKVKSQGLARMSWHGRDELDRLDASNPSVQTYEVIIGEEDCEWALIVAAMKDAIRPGYFSSDDASIKQYAVENLGRWNKDVAKLSR